MAKHRASVFLALLSLSSLLFHHTSLSATGDPHIEGFNADDDLDDDSLSSIPRCTPPPPIALSSADPESHVVPSSPKMPPTTIFSGTVLLPLFLFQFFNITTPFIEPNFSPFSSCDGTFSCGNIHNLSYPFTDGNQPGHYGPSEFHLSCVKNRYPELTVNSVVYRVLEVNLTGTSLVLARSDLWNNTCPTRFLNSSLDPNIFFRIMVRMLILQYSMGVAHHPCWFNIRISFIVMWVVWILQIRFYNRGGPD
ncbi:putative wall-associated receptor kinase, galacturonan-binding domain-containing protein [Helianthus anomalus]